jgi:hypothetical protein
VSFQADHELDLEVSRADLGEVRVRRAEPAALREGEALLAVERFGISANNITYATLGDALGYWSFFPAGDGWGRIPVWGFGRVVASATDALAEGVRAFGYLPMSTHLLLRPERVSEQGFTDAAPHRAQLPPAYNAYRLPEADPGYEPEREAEQILLRPLFYLSFLLDDYLAEEHLFGADSVILSSASSKASLGTAFLLARRGVEVIGLTSESKLAFVQGLGIYERAVAYEALDGLDVKATVFLDIAGSTSVRSAVHRHFGEHLLLSAIAGATRAGDGQLAEPSPPAGEQSGPPPVPFFAPDRLRTRTRDWGQQGLDARLRTAWRPFVEWCDGWLTIENRTGPDEVEAVYREVLGGRTSPDVADTLSMWA